jgi:hypothetical protein
MGEYARSLAIATGAAARWPNSSIRFMLSREAPYAASAPFPATLLASSPTHHSAAVIELIEEWRPDVVIFDNAGRTAQLRAARRCGAAVVYISARRRQRRKAFRLRWLGLVDEHWIAYPEFIAGSLSVLERFKLRIRRRPRVRYLDVILAGDRDAKPDLILDRVGMAAQGYVLLVPGGGTGHPGGEATLAHFYAAARDLAAAGFDGVFVGPSQPEADRHRRLRAFGTVPQSELAQLMRGARLVIANGGSTLLQAIACGKACIAVPIAGDQRERILRCVNAGVAVGAAPDADSILRAATTLLADRGSLDALAGRASALGLTDGIEVALRAIDGLIAANCG